MKDGSAILPKSQLKQLFQNLISKSIKFSIKDKPPVITISQKFLTPKDINDNKEGPAITYLQMQVRDNGIGFKKDNEQEIFSLFKRLHSQKEFEGSRLGLAICRIVVENHNGTIEASGAENEGATFTITLAQ